MEADADEVKQTDEEEEDFCLKSWPRGSVWSSISLPWWDNQTGASRRGRREWEHDKRRLMQRKTSPGPLWHLGGHEQVG